jgi:uncharacterized protein (DUF2126 family)
MKIRDPEGNLVDAIRVEVEHADDPWMIFHLEDGTTLKIRFVLSDVFRLQDKWTPDGDPVYVARSQNVVVALVPDELKREE